MSALRSVRDRARGYLRRGWKAIPVPFKSKNPNFSGWESFDLTEENLDHTFSGGPQNVGVRLGEPSGGLADTDLDHPIARLLAPRFLPRTGAMFGRVSALRSHWLHVIEGVLKSLSWRDPTAGEGHRATLLELRWTGRQTLFPGSAHPSGELIEWDEEGEPALVAASDLLRALGRLASATLLAIHWPSTGARHDAALALAGGLLRARWPEKDVVAFITAITFGAGDEESEDRIRTVVTSAQSLGANRPTTGWPTLAKLIDPRVVNAVRTWLGITDDDPGPADLPWDLPTPLPEGPRPPFPTERLPTTLRLYIAALAIATQTPPALAGLLVFAVLAAAAATRVAVRVRDGWKEPVNLFVAVALGPANRKSAVFAECVEPLEAFERAETARRAPEIAKAQSAFKIKKKELDALERKAASVDDRIGPEEKTAAKDRATALARELATSVVPEPLRLTVDDCSPEKLTNLLAAQGGRIAVMSPEGGVFGMMAGRYSATKQPNLDVYLKGHSGDPLRVDRVGRPPDHVPHPALSIGLAVQPGVIRQLAEKPEFRERGLPARFLYGMPFSWVGRRRIGASPIQTTVRTAYHRCVTAMLELPRYKAPDGSPLAKELKLSAEAEASFHEFQVRLEPRLGEGGDLEHIADWAGKLAGATCRIAGLLHLSEHAKGKAPWHIPITVETMQTAIRLAEEFFIPHALTAFAAMGADPSLEAAKKLLGWLTRAEVKAFSIRDAHQDLRKHQLSTAQVERAAQVLVEHGYIRPVSPDPSPLIGRPSSPRFCVNPRWVPQKAQKAQNPDESSGFGSFEESEAFEDASCESSSSTFEESEAFEETHGDETASSGAWEEVIF